MSDESETANKTLPHCRIKFLFSRGGKRCVILRRGPSKWVRLILWDMAKNEFLAGQWLNGPVQDFDISPNGEHIIYFVSYHKTRAPYLWTAISKPPYFTALAMWSISDAWGGNCAFVDASTIYTERGMYQSSVELSTRHSLEKYTLLGEQRGWDGKVQRYGWDFKRKRYGWTPVVPVDHPVGHGMDFLVWKKKLFKDDLMLCMQGMRGGYSKSVYWLESTEGRIPLSGVDCADLDPFGRLVASQNGALHIVQIGQQNEVVMDTIMDFNAQVPEKIQAPDHAKRW